MLHICGRIPETGAQVFVFFEAGDVNKPVYFAAAQSGPGWFAEHPNQHVFQSDNIRVRIDEEPDHPDSTCKFDSYNDKNSDISKDNGTKKGTKTRLDIEVLAKDINAVNIQIHGDVNMKIDGDWYVQHEGDKHETHIGDTYIKHEGDTYIEETGARIFKHIGYVSQYIEGSYLETITENYAQNIGADSHITIANKSDLIIGNNYTKIVNGSLKYNIIGGESKSIGEDQEVNIGGNSSITITGEKKLLIGKNYTINVNDDIEQLSLRGNISLKTVGKFEIFDENGNISNEGYANLGTKGNITITSTFGNIGINTIEDKKLADLEQETFIIPWNPSYLDQVALLATLVPGFDPDMIVEPLTPPTDLTSLLKFLQTAVMYDGFPTFLPCKMIMQNPAIETPVPDDWLARFRTIDDNWNNITNTAYWKLISKVIGNIDIKSWNGDINVQTYGTLGNAGNINLFANNRYGALPGYKVGNVNIVADTPFRIYTDPRDLFLDTHLMGKIYGKFAWFSHATNPNADDSLMPPTITVKPLQPVQELLQLLGVPFEFGFTTTVSNGGGCMQCITDVITQTAKDLQLFSIVPYVITEQLFLQQPEHHKFNASAKSLNEADDVPGGSVSILTQQSNGYGHAVDTYEMDEIYGSTNYPFGCVLINGVGSYDLHMGKNATFTTDTGNWKFGVTTTIETDWFYPSKGINPLDNLFGEMNVAMPGQIGQPVIKKKESNYYNSFNNMWFGSYKSVYDGMKDTGVYSLPKVKGGIFGSENIDYKLKVPYKTELTHSFKQKNSLEYDVPLNAYIIDDNVYSPYINISQINALADTNTNTKNENSNKSNNTKEPSVIQKIDNLVSSSIDDLDEFFDSILKKLDGGGYFYYTQLGEPDIWTLTTSGMVKTCKLKDQLPNTANAVSTIMSVLAALIKLIPLLGSVIGEAIQQFAKMLPNWRMPEHNDFYFNADYIFKEYNKMDYSIYMPIKVYNETGIIPWPMGNKIMSGRPVLYDMANVSLPNIAKVADGMVSVGTLIDPIGCIQKMITEQLPDLANDMEINTTIGVGGLPKIAKDIVKPVLGDINEILSANAGLFKELKLGGTLNLLNSEFDKKAIFYRVTAQLPTPPEISLSLSGEAYTLKCGILGEVDVLPVPDGEITLDVLDESVEGMVGGPFPPRSTFTIHGKELWNIPDGGAGFLGSGIIKAITEIFF